MFRIRPPSIGIGNIFVKSNISRILPTTIKHPFIRILFRVCTFHFRGTSLVVQVSTTFVTTQQIETETFVEQIGGNRSPESRLRVPDHKFVIRRILESSLTVQFYKYFLSRCRVNPCRFNHLQCRGGFPFLILCQRSF